MKRQESFLRNLGKDFVRGLKEINNNAPLYAGLYYGAVALAAGGLVGAIVSYATDFSPAAGVLISTSLVESIFIAATIAEGRRIRRNR